MIGTRLQLMLCSFSCVFLWFVAMLFFFCPRSPVYDISCEDRQLDCRSFDNSALFFSQGVAAQFLPIVSIDQSREFCVMYVYTLYQRLKLCVF
eukprot:m.30756 g.30756  ORF g.30756 m.30756 type:complete len:93 (+) comp5256_c0_seq1:5408-5686(+)